MTDVMQAGPHFLGKKEKGENRKQEKWLVSCQRLNPVTILGQNVWRMTTVGLLWWREEPVVRPAKSRQSFSLFDLVLVGYCPMECCPTSHSEIDHFVGNESILLAHMIFLSIFIHNDGCAKSRSNSVLYIHM